MKEVYPSYNDSANSASGNTEFHNLSSMRKTQPPDVFFKKAVLKNFLIFTGKHLCWNLFLIKLQTLRPETLLKRDLDTGVFL